MSQAETQIVAFDTHKFVKRLTSAGLDEGIAETLVDGQIDLMNANLATKQDVAEINQSIAEIRQDIVLIKKEIALVKQDIEQLRAHTDTKIAEVNHEIVLVRKDIEQLRTEMKQEIALVKKDIEQLRTDTKKDIEQLRTEMTARIAEVKNDLIKWILGMGVALAGLIVAQGGFIVAMIKLL